MKLGKWLALTATFVVLVLLCLSVGSVKVDFADVLRALFDQTSKHRSIVWGLRLPRVLMGLVTGDRKSVV